MKSELVPTKKLSTTKALLTSLAKNMGVKAMDLLGSKKPADVKNLAECQKTVKTLNEMSAKLGKTEKDDELTMDKVVSLVTPMIEFVKKVKLQYGIK